MIDFFGGEYSCLSNFYDEPDGYFTYEGGEYHSVEAAFQSFKTFNKSEQLRIGKLSPREAKREGRRVQLRSDWEKVKDGIMYDLVRAKFFQNESIQSILLQTGNQELIEGNSWRDTYWGVYQGTGKNKLGKILMAVRGELQKQRAANAPYVLPITTVIAELMYAPWDIQVLAPNNEKVDNLSLYTNEGMTYLVLHFSYEQGSSSTSLIASEDNLTKITVQLRDRTTNLWELTTIRDELLPKSGEGFAFSGEILEVVDIIPYYDGNIKNCVLCRSVTGLRAISASEFLSAIKINGIYKRRYEKI